MQSIFVYPTDQGLLFGPRRSEAWSIYPFVLDRLRLRLCATFFFCLFAILFADSFCPEDCEFPKAGPFGLTSFAIFPSAALSIP
jgi:hypothetical protein